MEIKNLLDENERTHIDSNEKMEAYLNAHHDRFHNLLFWANVAILFNFVLIITRMVGLYKGGAASLADFKVMLGVIFIAAVAFLYRIWRADTSLGEPDWDKIKVLLHYKVDIMNKQIKLISGYIVAYTLILLCSYIYYKSTRLVPPSKVLEATSPLSMVMYLIGTYSLGKCFMRRKKLLNGINEYDSIDREGV